MQQHNSKYACRQNGLRFGFTVSVLQLVIVDVFDSFSSALYSTSTWKACRTPRVTKTLLSLSMTDTGTFDQQSPHNELGKHHSSRNLINRRVCLFVWRLQGDTDVGSVRWRRHQRPSLAIAWIPANSLCDVSTDTGGDEMKGSHLFSTDTTAHWAQDHQTNALCAV